MLEQKIEEILKDPEIVEALELIVKYEGKLANSIRIGALYAGARDTLPAWQWSDIPVSWHLVRKMLLAGLVEKIGKKYYVLVKRKSIIKRLSVLTVNKHALSKKVKFMKETKSHSGLPPDLFDVIEGFEDLKEFIKIVLNSGEPVHVLLEGSPGTAKSLILMEVERVGGHFITAGTATGVGIRDLLFEDLPEILVIDEIEKIGNSKDLTSLLTWMENGRVVITKHGQREERHGKGVVFAACNTTKRIPPEMLDRFQRFKVKPYTQEQYIRVVTGYLTKRKGIKEDLAKFIAEEVNKYSVSVREAARIASLAKTKEDASKILDVIRRYRHE